MNDEPVEGEVPDPETVDSQPPERADEEPKEEAKMSELSTLANIFFEPGRTFKDLRRKPRFVLAGLIIVIAISAFNVLFIEKIGFKNLVESRIEGSAQTQQMPKEQRDQMIAQQSAPLFKYITYGATPVVMIIIFIIGALYYWGGAAAFGGTSSFTKSLSVWIYSSFAPVLIYMIANIIVLFLKSVDDIDLVQAQQGGLIQANPSMFVDAKASPVLATLLSAIDIFQIWGYILAAIGLKTVAKISSGSAWAIVLILALVVLTGRVIVALIF